MLGAEFDSSRLPSEVEEKEPPLRGKERSLGEATLCATDTLLKLNQCLRAIKRC
ncbi:MAG: hypothetical protein ACHBN1_21010 [Heteroscytonema crispum UTEX LB 1556]